MCALFVLALVFFPSLFEITPLTLPMLFVLVPTLFLATCLMPALQRIAEKAIRKAERRP
jgi:cation-transporting ATPase E